MGMRKTVEYREYSIEDAPDGLTLRRWIEEGIAMSGIFGGDKPLFTIERCGESMMLWWYRRYVLPKKG